MTDYTELPDTEKIRIASHFIKNAPPGEFNEVFNDVRVLLNNDKLLKEGSARAFSEYNTEQFMPCKVGDNMVLITKHGKTDGSSRFLDPSSKRSFHYHHLRKEADDIQPASIDDRAEPFRSSLEKAMQTYLKEHYPNGICTVYGSSTGANITLTVCIGDHKFSPKNFWNGRWRSEWSVTFTPGGSAELNGIMKVQVHYYEDGNVQLVSSKEGKETIKTGSESATAKEFVKLIEKSENEYQTALIDNYKTMSQTTFKALRRALPVTRTKVDWNKIAAYNIGSELKGR